ncbi:MAG: hypothetical protein PHG20_06195 [Geobacteraceae bacterium]|nr:hypothetical protein [Geobacteraceae bacterium]
MTIFYEKWLEKEYSCRECPWKGPAEDTGRGRMYRKMFLELCCPECSAFLDVIIFPPEDGCDAARNDLTEEQVKALEEAKEQERLYREKCLHAVEQLPELPDDDLFLVWDQEDSETLILHGETVIWREPLAYEAFDRFEQVAILLKEKYGTRLKDLQPANRSKLYLYGDYAPALEYLKKVRKDLFGVEAEE